MAESKFVYVTYIRTTPAKLWKALRDPEFTRQYWMGTTQESDWKVGSPWKIRFADGRVADTGEVLEFKPYKRLVLKWRNEFMPGLKKEGYTRMTYSLEKLGAQVKLTVVHEIPKAKSVFIGKVAQGWPMILASLKSLLETGKALKDPRG